MLRKYLVLLLCFTVLITGYVVTAPLGTFLSTWEGISRPVIQTPLLVWQSGTLLLGSITALWLYRIELLGPVSNLVRG